MKYRNLSRSFDVLVRELHFLYGKRNLIYAYWWGCKIGRFLTFDGKCVFNRYPGTEIIIGDNCQFRSRVSSNLIGINHSCILSTHQSNYKARLEIGNFCGFSGTVISAFKSIKIGNNVRCGANTLIMDADWHLDDIRSGEPADVLIEDNVWLGVNVVVLKGVTIGENSVIAACSVVTKNIPRNVIAAGNPCKVIRELK